MRVGILHNAYRYRGGEERVAEAEARSLEAAGYSVSRLTFDNRVQFASLGSGLKTALGAAVGWNTQARHRIIDWVRRERLDLVHIHNLFPFITPSGPDAIAKLRVPIVMTLHNFRPICATGTLTRGGRPCDACVCGATGPAIQNRCYRGSMPQSLAWAAARKHADRKHLWQRAITRFIAPSQHVMDTYVRAGFPMDKLTVRPHFTDINPLDSNERHGAIVVGRVEQAKGIPELIRCWPPSSTRLTVAGAGPDLEACKRMAADNVRFIGHISQEELATELSRAALLISASQLPETFGLTPIEAAACRTPTVAFAVGGVATIIDHQQTGVLVEPGDFSSLVEHAQSLACSPQQARDLGNAAHHKYLKNYSPEAGLQSLARVYRTAIAPQGRSAA